VVSQAELLFEGRLLHYEVVRSSRRRLTIEITVVPGKGVRVAAPMHASEARIAEVVRAKGAWVWRVLAKPPRPDPVQVFAHGRTLHYLGKAVALHLVPANGTRPAVALRRGSLRVSLPEERGQDETLVRDALRHWYAQRALRRLTGAVERWARVMGLQPARVLVRDQRTLWGSCASDGTLRFNWRTVQVAPALMDYVVVHELAHLKYRSHGPRFWQFVGRFLPDYLERRRRLRHAGRALAW
jgi:predicted metal-dependent hydrolase